MKHLPVSLHNSRGPRCTTWPLCVALLFRLGQTAGMGAYEVERTSVKRREGEEWPLVEFTVTAPEFPGLIVKMTYSLPGGIKLHSVDISADVEQGEGGASSLSPGVIRNLPLATWDRSLVMRVWSVMRHPANNDLYELHYKLPQAEGNYHPRAAVEKLYPGLAEDETKAGVRRYNSLMRLAYVARTYADLILDGERNPTGVIAELEGVKPVTVRSWLHRAKNAGFYPLFGLQES